MAWRTAGPHAARACSSAIRPRGRQQVGEVFAQWRKLPRVVPGAPRGVAIERLARLPDACSLDRARRARKLEEAGVPLQTERTEQRGSGGFRWPPQRIGVEVGGIGGGKALPVRPPGGGLG